MTSSVPIEWPGALARGATSDIGRDRRHASAARSFEKVAATPAYRESSLLFRVRLRTDPG